MVYNPSSVANHVWLRIPLAEQQKIRLDTEVAEKNSINVLEIGVKFLFFQNKKNQINLFKNIDHQTLANFTSSSN